MTAIDTSILPRRRIRHVRQGEAAECGIACLTMVANHWGHDVDLSAMRGRFGASSRGMGLRQLMQAGESVDLVSQPVKTNLDGLYKLSFPAILHWDMNHYVVAERTKGGRIRIHDPATGPGWLDREALSKHFTGVALQMRPSASFTRIEEGQTLRLRQLWSGAHGFRRAIFQAGMLSLVLQAYVLASPYMLQAAIDDAIPALDQSLLTVLALGFGLFALINAGAGALRSFVLLASGTKLSLGISSNVARRLMRLPVEWFERRTVGDVLSRFQSVLPVQRLLTESASAALIDGLMAVVTLVVMAIYSPLLAFVAVASSGLYAIVRMATFSAERQAQNERIVALGKEQGAMIESLRGIVTLRLSGRETMRHAVWQTRLADYLGSNYSAERIKAIQAGAHALISGIELVLITLLAARAAMAGGFSVGMIFAFLAYRLQFSTATHSLVDRTVEFRMLSLHLHRLSDIALAEEDPGFSEEYVPRPGFEGRLELKGVRHSYSRHDPEVLKGVDLVIEPGEHVAITGPSGGGKSTLVKIILGLVDPSVGDVLVDGTPLARYGRRAFREHVGAVLQDDLLFAGSIAENVAGFETVDQERLDEALRAASIADDVERMPLRHLTPVGDMGSTLSGGQRQRLLLARALYRRPRFLVMDEGTAHLDVDHERAVGEAIAAMGITRIVVAHRKETISAADRVVRLVDGRIEGMTSD